MSRMDGEIGGAGRVINGGSLDDESPRQVATDGLSGLALDFV